MNFSVKKIGLLFLVAQSAHSTTYEDIRQQIELEANTTIKQAQDKFTSAYLPSLVKIGATTLIAGLFAPLAVHATKNNNLKLASVYSALAGLFAYFSILQHAELMEDRRVTNETIFEADRVYHKKLAHIHTRHYLQDIAKYKMDRLQAIADNFQPEQAPENKPSQ